MQSQKLLRLAKLPVLMLLAIPMASCVTTTGSGGTEAVRVYCQASRPILWSRQDTQSTVEQVKEHNAVGKRLCGWGKPAK